MVKKGQVYEGIVESISFPNKGQVMVEGQPVIVKNGLPGQKVRFSVNKVRKGKAEGRLLEVLEQGALEQTPVCGKFGECGGCLYLSLPYEEQLHIKERQVKDILDSVVQGDYEFQGILASPNPFGYRNKMEFSFGDSYKDGPLALGMHKRGSFYDIVTVDQCQIVDADYRRILIAVLSFFQEKNTPFFHKLRHEGYLRHLLVRKGQKSQEILIDLITTSQNDEDSYFGAQEQKAFVDSLLALPLQGKIAGILHTVNDSLADAVRNDGTTVLYGQDYFYEELLGLRFRITPFSFFQTNSLGAEVLYSTARSYVGETKDCTIFDLYSGTGTIAQMLAPVAKKVVGVEIVEEAVEAAKENARLNGLDNCEFLAGDVLKVIDELQDKPDLIVLDPPRDGIHPKALKKIIAFGVEQMVYISCKPTSLARDLVVLQEEGYCVKKAVAVDMFPWTGNVETVVLLSKGEVDSKKVRVEFSLEDMDMSDFQDSATYTQIKDYVLEHSGLKVSNLYISQIKRKCGIEVGKNYNLRKATRRMDCSQTDSTTAANLENDNSQGLPKSEDSRQPQCPPEKENAIRDAFEYFGLI